MMRPKAAVESQRTTLRARYVFPVASEPIAEGAVTFEGGRLAAVGRRVASGESGAVHELGNAAILPGFVNAHAHLDASCLAAPLGYRGISLVDWIRRVIASRRQAMESEGPSPIMLGLQESLRAGTTTLGDIAQSDWPLDAAASAPLNMVLFRELIAPTAERIPAAMKSAETFLRAMAEGMSSDRVRPGLSLHAPYSVHQRLLKDAIAFAVERRLPVAMHLAESREELLLMREGKGPFRGLLEELGAWEPGAMERRSRPLDYLRQLAAAPRALIVHGNYLDDEEMAFLGVQAGRMSVAYCPRTHDWFGHEAYPLEKMLAAGVRVLLGTDGRGSSPDLELLAEMRCVARRHPAVAGRQILRMGTIAGAEALGYEKDAGTLEPGKSADLAIVALPNREADDPHQLLFDADRPVVACYCRGILINGEARAE